MNVIKGEIQLALMPKIETSESIYVGLIGGQQLVIGRDFDGGQCFAVVGQVKHFELTPDEYQEIRALATER